MDRLKAWLAEEAKSLRHQLESGTCNDITQYKVIVAQLQLMRHISELIVRFENEEDFVD